MKLNEVYTKPLKEVLESMDMVDMKIHTDDEGNIQVVELKYRVKEQSVNSNGKK